MRKTVYRNVPSTTHRTYWMILFASLLLFNSSCQKYLDVPSKGAAIPNSLKDLQALLDWSGNTKANNPELETVADNYYVSTDSWQRVMTSRASGYNSLNYIWEGTESDGGWTSVYTGPVYISNTVLDILPAIDQTDHATWNSIKGQALFSRAFSFWQIAQLYSKPYAAAMEKDLGIPLKMHADIAETYVRGLLNGTYEQILSDLRLSLMLLPPTTILPSRPTKVAAYALLSRVYLSMSDYVKAGLYADSCLQYKSDLLDYNNLLPISARSIPKFPDNPELIWANDVFPVALTSNQNLRVDSSFYQSFHNDDLRKSLFFIANTDGTYRFRGSYSFYTDYFIFTGIGTDEMYLTRAECSARAGFKDSAMNDLNRLMVRRWKSGNFTPFAATNAIAAKDFVLSERRKELCFRGLRWPDIRRLNLEGANISITRILGGKNYILAPNDPRATLLIPRDVINYSGIPQNSR